MNKVESGEVAFHKTLIWLVLVTRALAQTHLLRVQAIERLQVNPLRHGIYRIFVYNDFMKSPNVPVAFRECERFRFKVNLWKSTYDLGWETLIPSPEVRGMAVWQEALFAFMASNAPGRRHSMSFHRSAWLKSVSTSSCSLCSPL